MLSHPPSRTSAHDRAQAAAIFGVLGAVAGGLILAAALWMYGVSRRIDEQARALRSFESSSGVRGLAIDALLADGAEASKRMADQYARTVRERDETRQALLDRTTLADSVASRTRDLEAANARLEAALEGATATAKANGEAAEESKRLRADLEELVAEAEKRERTLAEQDTIIEALGRENGTNLLSRYAIAWYVAIAGWVAALLLTLGLVATLLTRQPRIEPEADSRSAGRPLETP